MGHGPSELIHPIETSTRPRAGTWSTLIPEGSSMFERFTDPARRVVVFAQDEARRLNHVHIGPEHLLLGVVREGDDLGARALATFGLTLDDTRRRVEADLPRGLRGPGSHIPFTEPAK